MCWWGSLRYDAFTVRLLREEAALLHLIFARIDLHPSYAREPCFRSLQTAGTVTIYAAWSHLCLPLPFLACPPTLLPQGPDSVAPPAPPPHLPRVSTYGGGSVQYLHPTDQPTQHPPTPGPVQHAQARGPAQPPLGQSHPGACHPGYGYPVYTHPGQGALGRCFSDVGPQVQALVAAEQQQQGVGVGGDAAAAAVAAPWPVGVHAGQYPAPQQQQQQHASEQEVMAGQGLCAMDTAAGAPPEVWPPVARVVVPRWVQQ